MFTVIPDYFIKVTHHLERVLVEIDLCGCTKLSNNWFLSVFLRDAVILIHCLR